MKPDSHALKPGLDIPVEGDQDGWARFFKEQDPLIVSVVSWSKWRFTASVRDDVCQKIRVELVRALPRFKADSSLNYFIKRICVHRCIDEIRRKVRQDNPLVSLVIQDADTGQERERDLPAGDAFDPVVEVEREELIAAVRTLVEALDPTCRTAVQMFYLKGLTYQQMSDELGVAVNTVGSRLAKCLNKLKKGIGTTLGEYLAPANDE